MKNNHFSANHGKLAEQIMAASGGQIDQKAVDRAVSGDTAALIDALPEEDRKKLNGILSDQGALQKLMKNSAMQELMKKFSGGGKNG